MPPEVPTQAFIGLGANLGNARQAVLDAIEAIHRAKETTVIRSSALYGSTPVEADGADYVNAVVEVLTRLDAQALLEQLHGIEQRAGRERSYLHAPRTLDLDLLLFGDAVIQTDTLTVPHPRMRMRAFVLLPLHEIAPDKVTADELNAVSSQGVWRIDADGL